MNKCITRTAKAEPVDALCWRGLSFALASPEEKARVEKTSPRASWLVTRCKLVERSLSIFTAIAVMKLKNFHYHLIES
ncbi:hypothetical protein I8752_00115 [Nostocaceae cyanobacterium CENA369]|uniref:Uncharacterized protein n=1 Tax=Dendronalium phyllosphericum CENA369 TaxID=1725256 RepID=A0A8J7I381_9NOST|nr:hypothetical protein [Dendronalium phyllosphericum]MBH8571457.1 hypothetical protein [Dendronalium phyllosphericum CENA369]